MTTYICHYCLDYKTTNKSDMLKHFKRVRRCKCATLNTYEEASVLSKTKKYIFEINIDKLVQNDFLFIINHYQDDINYIYDDFMKKKKENSKKNDIEKELNNEIIEKKKHTHHLDAFYDEEKKAYICYKCESAFNYKQSLERHIGTSICVTRQKYKNIVDEKSTLINHISKKEETKNQIYNTYIQNNNIQNNNIQNNNFHNNNFQNTTYNISLKDFIHEKYDLTHIKDDFYLQKDFYLYPNFLKMIMENQKNQNIFFNDNEAIIFSDNELNKMSSDKAGYIILDKLSQSFDQLLNNQDDESREYYSFISKYYYLLKGQYKHDTIYKHYSVDDRKFVYTANSNLFRSRDKYLNKIVSTLSEFNSNARNNMCISLDELKNIPIMNPNIEDFASTKMRYRDLKERN